MERERFAKGCFCSAKMVKKLKRHTERMQLCNPIVHMDELHGGNETGSKVITLCSASKTFTVNEKLKWCQYVFDFTSTQYFRV